MVRMVSSGIQIVQRLEAHRKGRGDKHISLNDEQVQQMALPYEVRYMALKDLLEKTVDNVLV